MANEPEIKIEEIGTAPEPQKKEITLDEMLRIVNRDLGGIIGKMYEVLPVDVAQFFAKEVGTEMDRIRLIIDGVVKLNVKEKEEPLVPEIGVMEVPAEGEEKHEEA